MESQYPPGPWQHWGHDIIVKDTDGLDVVICGVGKSANKRSHSYSEPSPQQIKAIICLIAAAPELLAALENLIKIAEGWPMSRAYHNQITAEAHSVLAKAKGENR